MTFFINSSLRFKNIRKKETTDAYVFIQKWKCKKAQNTYDTVIYKYAKYPKEYFMKETNICLVSNFYL